MNKNIIYLFVGIIIGLLVGGLITYMYFRNSPRNSFSYNRFNNNISESAKSEVISVFENNPTKESINNYCTNNRENCMYYCRQINSNNSFCNNLFNMTRGGMER